MPHMVQYVMAQQNPPSVDEASLDHAELGVSVCENCESPRLNLVREENGVFELRCGHCEATLMSPFYPPGWEDCLIGVTPDDEETLAVPSYDDLLVSYSGGHAYLQGDAEAWGRLERASRDIRRKLSDGEPLYNVKCRSPTCDEWMLATDVPHDEAMESYDAHDCSDGLKQLVPTN